MIIALLGVVVDVTSFLFRSLYYRARGQFFFSVDIVWKDGEHSQPVFVSLEKFKNECIPSSAIIILYVSND
jgi:hypothetical protein